MQKSKRRQSNQPVTLAVPPKTNILHHLIRSDVFVGVPAGRVGGARKTTTASTHLAPLALGLSVHS
jgi:hypothetical protein